MRKLSGTVDMLEHEYIMSLRRNLSARIGLTQLGLTGNPVVANCFLDHMNLWNMCDVNLSSWILVLAQEKNICVNSKAEFIISQIQGRGTTNSIKTTAYNDEEMPSCLPKGHIP